MKKYTTRELVYLASLVSLSVVLTRVLSLRIAIGSVDAIRIGFGALPLILAGITLGPVAGGIVGAIADVVGYVINPMGAYMPHFTLTSALTGLLPGFVVFYMLRGNQTYWALICAITFGQLISSIILVPYFLQSLFGIPIQATLLPRIVAQVIQVPIYACLLRTLLSYSPMRITRATKPVS